MQAGTDAPTPSPRILPLVIGVVLLFAGLGGGFLIAKALPSSSSAPGPVSGLARPSVVPLEPGWYRNTSITYILFGLDPNVTAPILAFFEAASPNTPVAGQHNIIDTLPGQPSYSDFWQVFKVLAPSSYAADSIRSLADAVASGYSIVATNVIVNCPVENPGATIQSSSQTLEQGWYRGQAVYYFSAGTNTTGYGSVIRSAPIWTFVYANGTPVPGQRNVVDVLPGQPGYSDLWQLTNVVVGSNYVPNSLKSAGAILADAKGGSVTLQTTSGFVNCPILT